MTSTKKTVENDFPNEIKVQMQEFRELMAQLKESIKPLTEGYQELQEKISDPLDSARVDLATVYVINSLFWVYLITKGENPRDHDIMRELSRLKAFMARLKTIQSKEDRLTVNGPAAARVVRNALFDPKNPSKNKSQTSTAPQGQTEIFDDEEDSGPKRKRRRNR